MFTVDQFLTVYAAFCEVKGIERSTLSRRIFSRATRIEEIDRGGDIGFKLLQEKMQWLSDHWPADADWPKGIERPAPRLEAAR